MSNLAMSGLPASATRTTRRRRGAAAVAAVAAAGSLVGCGGGSDGPVVATVEVEAFEMAFDPERIIVPEGRIRFEVTNTGAVPHTFVIQQRGFKLRVFDTGETASNTATLPEGGYFFYCDIDGHRDLGMAGELFVGDVEVPTTVSSDDGQDGDVGADGSAPEGEQG